ncbi:hypothetical protein EG329_005196 [Mollisiaceae sp. DMI_Dod_QoI]|nr:hypothetical protein EG329_005196 [Helotiales sp. DMI_Dod_QoI]
MSSDTEDSLEDQIVNAFVESQFPVDVAKQQFLPHGELDRLITQDAVVQQLNIDYDADSQLIDFICLSAKMVFANALISSLHGKGLREAMKRFKDLGFCDKSLPVGPELEQLTPMPPWNRMKRRYFIENQWRFLAPVFPSPDPNKDLKLVLEPEHILPFTHVDEQRREGTFGNVYQVTIHPSHQEVLMMKANGTPANAAIKELKASAGEDQKDSPVYKEWNAEATALHELSDLSHPHMIQVRAIITRGKRHYFMFQWADSGCLRDFYLQTKRPKLDSGFVKKIVLQLKGLADALDALHNYSPPTHKRKEPSHNFKEGQESYRHGDLKPENILIFEDGTPVGTWRVADMGLAKHHFAPTGARGDQTTTRYGTPSYEPPEVIKLLNGPQGARSRLYDIWSMGCITLELILWLLYGYDWLLKFNNSLKAFPTNPSSYWMLEVHGDDRFAKVHSGVTACMDHIATKDPECTKSTAIRDLLDIVRTKLLVVALPRQSASFLHPGIVRASSDVQSSGPTINLPDEMGQTPDLSRGPFRAKAKDFCAELEKILQKGEKNECYWFTGKTRDGVATPPILPTPGSSFLAPQVPGIQIPLVDRTKDVSLPGGLAGLRASSPRLVDHTEDVSRQASSKSSAECEFSLEYHYEFHTNSNLSLVSNRTSMSLRIDLSIIVDPDEFEQLNKFWEFPVDNKFAETLLRETSLSKTFSQSPKAANLCGKCQKMDFWADAFRFTDTLSELAQQSTTCDFCKMRWNLCKHLDPTETSTIRFDRLDSMLRMNETYPPVLSLLRGPDQKTPIPMRRLQIGVPKLPESGSDTHFEILQQWLEHCDNNHSDCKPLVKLYDTQPTDDMKYFALSHPWGKPPPDPFCTYTSNIEQHKQKIKVSDLPATFQHAVTITRALGLRYLWIDSICIIQGSDGDFNQEAKRMEDVFSKAYCVLAASSATGQYDGFLKPRENRNYLTFEREGLPKFYVCDVIDNFNQHVLEGHLNKRGWVLQERVLAHRTIYFTDKQTYWECGDGVRCETLTKMHNKLASFLGDSNFPKVAIESSHGGKIRLYQDLYMQYSRLAFTRQSDRPVAIAGLEKRLIQSFGVHGGFGVFDDDGLGMLRRSLLWHRGAGEKSLQKIEFAPAGKVPPLPSWSWMAHSGGIDYLDLPFGKIEWEAKDIRSPWLPEASGVWYSSDEVGVVELSAVARDFDKKAVEGINDAKVIYDVPVAADWDWKRVKCVVLGRLESTGTVDRKLENRRHWIMVVMVTDSRVASGNQICKRVGVGFVPGKLIDLDQRGTPVKIR